MHHEEILQKIVEVDKVVRLYKNDTETMIKSVNKNNLKMHELKIKTEKVISRNEDIWRTIEETEGRI